MKCTYCNRLASVEEFSKKTRPVIDHAKASTSGFSLKLNTKDSEPDLTEKTDLVKKEQTERKAAFSTDAGYMDMHIYHYPSCGADLMVASTQAATYCSYCGSPSIVYDRLSKELKPSKIIPFKLSEAQALSCIRNRFGHGSYIPPKIRELTVKDIHAIYIPF